MWQQIVEYIGTHWLDWVVLIISGALGVLYRKLIKRQKEEAQKNKALCEGVQALLREKIIDKYNHYNDKGFCPIYAKESMRRLYAAYHALGGNDVATKLKDKLLAMPTGKDEET